MSIKTHLAHSIELSNKQAKYDANVKNILADKQVLTKILKYTTKEFEDCDESIIIKCIEDTPEIGTHSIYPGKAERITGMNNESTIPHEGDVTFDIRFYATTPGKERVKIILNVEAQKEYHVGYDFPARGIFYCSRMISEQLDTEFAANNYNDIKKVYSIWICMQTPEKYANTISEYSIKRQNLYGTFSETEKHDLLSVVIVRLSKSENAEKGNIFHQFLTLLLSEKLDVETKKKKLRIEHNIQMNKKLEGDVIGMCNLSEIIVENAQKEAFSQGLVNAVDNIIKNLNLSLEKACEALETTPEAYYEARKELGLEAQ